MCVTAVWVGVQRDDYVSLEVLPVLTLIYPCYEAYGHFLLMQVQRFYPAQSGVVENKSNVTLDISVCSYKKHRLLTML